MTVCSVLGSGTLEEDEVHSQFIHPEWTLAPMTCSSEGSGVVRGHFVLLSGSVQPCG